MAAVEYVAWEEIRMVTQFLILHILCFDACLSAPDGKQQNWEAVAANVAESDKKLYYINVCNKLISGNASCPEDAAVCAVGECYVTSRFQQLVRLL